MAKDNEDGTSGFQAFNVLTERALLGGRRAGAEGPCI